MRFASNIKKSSLQNGIDINIPKQQERSRNIAAVCSQILLVLFAVFGATYSFIGSFHLKVLPATVGVYILLFVLIFSFAFAVKKWAKFILPPAFLLFGLAGWYFFEDIIQGFILTTNDIMETFTANSDWVFNVYDVQAGTAQQYAQRETVFVVFVLFAITGIVSDGILCNRSFLTVFFTTFPFIFAALFFTITPPLLPLLLLCACWIALGVQRISAHKVKKEKKKKAKTDLSEDPSNQITHQLHFLSVGMLSLCLALVFCIFPQSTYVRDPGVTGARNALKDIFEQGNLFSSWQSGGISGGNLKNSGNLSFTGETVLKIKTQNESAIYLRGFVGSTYTGDRWQPAADEIYNQHSMAFNTLNGQNFNPQNLTSKYMNMQEIFSSSNMQPYSISIQNIHANRHYVYAPYALITTPAELPDAVFANDEYIKANSWFGLSDYSLRAYTGNSHAALNIRINSDINIQNYYQLDYRNQAGQLTQIIPWAQDYLNDEHAYRSYIYDTDTALPAEIKAKALKLCEEKQFYKNSLNDEIIAVQTYLAENYQYTLAPGKTPANRDFADYFLFENRKGYCIHFATAATVLLRAMGIPARYAEGYIANQSDLTHPDSDGYASIKDSRAHAWTEVYIPLYGWIPVEMTPGFYRTNSSELSANAGEEPQTNPKSESGTVSSSAPESEVAPSSKPESSQAPTSSALSSSSSNIGQADGNTNIFINSTVSAWLPFLFLFLILIVLLAVLYGNRKYAIHWRQQNFHLANTNESALAIYAYIRKIFAFYGYKYQSDTSPAEYAKQAEQALPQLNIQGFEGITQIAQKARFSQHKITDAELESMNAFAASLAKSSYGQLSRRKKLLFRYWYRLN